MNKSDITADIEEGVLAASRIMVNILAESLMHEKVEGITVPQFRILDMIYSRTDKPSEIARMLDVSPPAITFLLERLEERGLLKRVFSTSDRRRIELELTEAGRDLVKRVNACRKRHLKRVLKGMDERARSQLESSLRDFSRSYMDLKTKGV
jgi:DNA-binding MarR family transcriptional regulator